MVCKVPQRVHIDTKPDQSDKKVGDFLARTHTRTHAHIHHCLLFVDLLTYQLVTGNITTNVNITSDVNLKGTYK